MADGETSIALVALVVGLVALAIATGQLLQQIFSTADGYRRCTSNIMGPWAKRTYRIWRWSQFRFETRFMTPEIVLQELQQLGEHGGGPSSQGNDVVPIEKLPELDEVIRNDPDNTDGDNLVSWIAFLRQLHRLSRLSGNQEKPGVDEPERSPSSPRQTIVNRTQIGVVVRERSWDLMPPDAFRPAASCSLGTMIALALRLGMTWEGLNVEVGVLRAEGAGQSLLSTMIRGFGIVFQYNNTRIRGFGGPLDYLHDSQLGPFADKLACGILPRSDLNGSDISLSGSNIQDTSERLAKALTGLGVSSKWAYQTSEVDRLQRMQRDGFVEPAGFPIHDMISVVSPFLHRRDSSVTRTPYPVQTSVALSAFLFVECRTALLEGLREVPVKTPRLADVLRKLEQLSERYKADFSCQWDNAVANGRSGGAEDRRAFVDDLRGIHDTTTEFFADEEASGVPFKALVAAHVEMAAKVSFELYPQGDVDWSVMIEWWRAVARGYVENLEGLCRNICSRCSESGNTSCTGDYDVIRDAWWMMILRGISWRMSIVVVRPQRIVPSHLYDDNTRVYLM